MAEVIARTDRSGAAQRARSRSSPLARAAGLIEDLLDAGARARPDLARADAATVPPLVERSMRSRVTSAMSCCSPLDAGDLARRSPALRRDHARARAADRVLRPSYPRRRPADLAELLAFAQAGGGAARAARLRVRPRRSSMRWRARSPIAAGPSATASAAAPYRIDLAIVDPNDPERYVLAIEHDGVAYAGALVGARSRSPAPAAPPAPRLAAPPPLVARLVDRPRARDPARPCRDRHRARGEPAAPRLGAAAKRRPRRGHPRAVTPGRASPPDPAEADADAG